MRRARGHAGRCWPTCCPSVDAEDALRWLAGCAFADERAGGVTLHELVRRPYRAELWERTGELRARARSACTRAAS